MKKAIILAIVWLSFIHSISAQWVQTSAPGEAIVRTLATNGTTLFAGGEDGVFLSSDNGTNWSAVNNGLTTSHPCMSLALKGENIIAGKTDGIFISSDYGTNWTKTNLIADVNDLAIFGPYIFAASSQGVYMSEDSGYNWTATGITSEVYKLLVSGNTIFAGANEDTQMFLSTDSGTNWSTTGLAKYNVFELALCDSTIIACVGGGQVFRSSDHGASWTEMTNISLISSFAVDGTNIFAGTYGGVFHSFDYGENWIPWNTNIEHININSLIIKGTDIYAGTWLHGIWKRSLSEMVGVIEVKGLSHVVVYPNPAKNEITVENASQVQKGDVTIYNLQGQLVIEQQLTEIKMNLNISLLEKGIYLLQLRSGLGTEVIKFVKE